MQLSVVILLLVLTSVTGYHFDSIATDCWIIDYLPDGTNTLIGPLSFCPYDIILFWYTPPPSLMMEGVIYGVGYGLNISANDTKNYVFGSDALGLGLCTHGNIHACKDVLCEPSTQVSPGLVTETPATKSPIIFGETTNTCSFNGTLQLEAGEWNIIAHIEIIVNKITYSTAIEAKRMVSSPAPPTSPPWLIPAIVAPVVLFILGLIAIIVKFNLSRKIYPEQVTGLPNPLMWFFDIERIKRSNYNKSNTDPPFYYSEVRPGSKEETFFNKLSLFLGMEKIILIKKYTLISPTLAQNFSNIRQVFIGRLTEGEATFFSQSWKNSDPTGSRKYTLDIFKEKLDAQIWNKGLSLQECPILPVVHGTNESLAWKIAAGGFAVISSLDVGWYGKGIYFSTNATYITPYWACKANPTILICLSVPGNIYPVTEGINEPNSLKGQHLKSGYQSHYVITTKSGHPCTSMSGGKFDELVVFQEAQVIPIFLVTINGDENQKIIQEFFRVVVSPTEKSFSNIELSRQSSDTDDVKYVLIT